MTECPGQPQDSATKVDSPPNRKSLFAEIIERHQGPLLRYVRRVAGTQQDQADDVVQECFLRLHKAWGRSSEPPMERVGAWLFTVAHNLTMDLIRKHNRRRAAQDESISQADPEDDLGVIGQITQSEAASAALTAMDRLPDGQKQVVLMKVLEGLTFRQVAKATGLSLGNVNYKLNQALNTLARQLKRSGHL